MSDVTADEILKFWFEDIDRSCWFKKDAEFDRDLERQFGKTYALAKDGQLNHWCDTPAGCLAAVTYTKPATRTGTGHRSPQCAG